MAEAALAFSGWPLNRGREELWTSDVWMLILEDPVLGPGLTLLNTLGHYFFPLQQNLQ